MLPTTATATQPAQDGATVKVDYADIEDMSAASATIPVDRFAGGLGAVRVWPSPTPAAASGPACASPAG